MGVDARARLMRLPVSLARFIAAWRKPVSDERICSSLVRPSIKFIEAHGLGGVIDRLIDTFIFIFAK